MSDCGAVDKLPHALSLKVPTSSDYLRSREISSAMYGLGTNSPEAQAEMATNQLAIAARDGAKYDWSVAQPQRHN